MMRFELPAISMGKVLAWIWLVFLCGVGIYFLIPHWDFFVSHLPFLFDVIFWCLVVIMGILFTLVAFIELFGE